MSKKVILVITDGIGHNTSNNFNAFTNAKTPTYDYMFKNVPHSLIHTYGEHIGLPSGQMGNSEVGHMTIGAGRILDQDLVKINKSIENDTLKNNTVLKNTIVKSNNIHLIALLSDGGVHSHIKHIIEIAKISKNMNKQKVFIHIISDGRDVSPTSACDYIQQIIDICDEQIQIASISGRYFTMDRDNNWDRIEKAYNAIVFAQNKYKSNDILKYIRNSYENNIYDEFIEPLSFQNYNGFEQNDGIIFCNFRSDRIRQISNAIANPKFDKFKVSPITLNIVTMTAYDEKLPLNTIFKKEIPKNILSQIISNNGCSQVHIAETEKYAHVTFFFNGGREEEFLNEKRVLIPSPSVATYDLQAQMSAPQVGIEVIKAMQEKNDFIVVNFANGDMVGHTGNYEASILAVQAVDKELNLIIKKAKEKDYDIIITSDHGNCEKMRDEDGNTLTNHTVGDVYCFIISNEVKEVKTGSLNNIASTVLKLMNIKKPQEMNEALI